MGRSKLFLQILCLSLYVITFSGLVDNCKGHYSNVTRKLGRPGPQYYPTQGEPWPKPQFQLNFDENFMVVRPAIFRFKVIGNTCDILEEALKRYYLIIFKQENTVPPYLKGIAQNKTWKTKPGYQGYLNELLIDQLSPCEDYPHDDMDESYDIQVGTPETAGIKALLIANSNWGIIRGLETFSQLLYPSEDYTTLLIRATLIRDFPRFQYRSILLDSSRHYLSKKVIFQNLDLMAMNKFNVFHWHIVDDQSFPYQSKAFPDLSDKGAYHAYTHIYTQADVAEVIEYARFRGIRVIPEFDTPGHTQAWGPAIPGLLTECCNKAGEPTGQYGPVDPSRPENYEFLKKFFQEIVTVYKDKYVHLGGDEVDFSCWKSNPNITKFMKSANITNYPQLESFYMQRLIEIIENYPQNNSYIVWQEVVDNGAKVSKDALVSVWIGSKWEEEMARVTSLGYRVVLSACWYLDYISYGIDWIDYYKCDPHDFMGTNRQKNLVFGGGAAMWGELADSTNVIPRLWPRAAAPAERLWSSYYVTDVDEAAPRLEEHRCRLLKRGYNVQPANGPGFCMVSWD